MDTTSRIIGHDAREEWRKNDGVVPVISSLHPSNQPFINVTNDVPHAEVSGKLNQSYKDGIMSILFGVDLWISNVKVNCELLYRYYK